jgi:hypothetical protein
VTEEKLGGPHRAFSLFLPRCALAARSEATTVSPCEILGHATGHHSAPSRAADNAKRWLDGKVRGGKPHLNAFALYLRRYSPTSQIRASLTVAGYCGAACCASLFVSFYSLRVVPLIHLQQRLCEPRR